jgi:hypothetical protein
MASQQTWVLRLLCACFSTLYCAASACGQGGRCIAAPQAQPRAISATHSHIAHGSPEQFSALALEWTCGLNDLQTQGFTTSMRQSRPDGSLRPQVPIDHGTSSSTASLASGHACSRLTTTSNFTLPALPLSWGFVSSLASLLCFPCTCSTQHTITQLHITILSHNPGPNAFGGRVQQLATLLPTPSDLVSYGGTVGQHMVSGGRAVVTPPRWKSHSP